MRACFYTSATMTTFSRLARSVLTAPPLSPPPSHDAPSHPASTWCLPIVDIAPVVDHLGMAACLSMLPARLLCSDFVSAEGLRRVRPYTYEFKTHAKQRWLGRTLVDVFSEFPRQSRPWLD